MQFDDAHRSPAEQLTVKKTSHPAAIICWRRASPGHKHVSKNILAGKVREENDEHRNREAGRIDRAAISRFPPRRRCSQYGPEQHKVAPSVALLPSVPLNYPWATEQAVLVLGKGWAPLPNFFVDTRRPALLAGLRQAPMSRHRRGHG